MLIKKHSKLKNRLFSPTTISGILLDIIHDVNFREGIPYVGSKYIDGNFYGLIEKNSLVRKGIIGDYQHNMSGFLK